MICESQSAAAADTRRPHESNDPIAAAAELVSHTLPVCPAGDRQPDAVVVSFGQFMWAELECDPGRSHAGRHRPDAQPRRA